MIVCIVIFVESVLIVLDALDCAISSIVFLINNIPVKSMKNLFHRLLLTCRLQVNEENSSPLVYLPLGIMKPWLTNISL